MAYVPSSGRLYYTVSGSSTLYYRYFEAREQRDRWQTFTAGTLPSAVTSMTIAGGKLYYTTAAGLSSIAFANGVTSGSSSLVTGSRRLEWTRTVRFSVLTDLAGGWSGEHRGRSWIPRPPSCVARLQTNR